MNNSGSEVIEAGSKINPQQEETRLAQLAQEAELAAKSMEQPQLLDKKGLAAKLLECAEEKIVRGGQVNYANDAKDRLGFLRLYAEVMGLVGKAIELTNNVTNNEMKVTLVKPETKQDIKTIETGVGKVEEATTVIPLRIKAV